MESPRHSSTHSVTLPPSVKLEIAVDAYGVLERKVQDICLAVLALAASCVESRRKSPTVTWTRVAAALNEIAETGELPADRSELKQTQVPRLVFERLDQRLDRLRSNVMDMAVAFGTDVPSGGDLTLTGDTIKQAFATVWKNPGLRRAILTESNELATTSPV